MKKEEIKKIFENKAGLIRLFKILHGNYRKNNGEFGISINLTRFTDENELNQIGEFLGLSEYDLAKRKTIKVIDIFTEWNQNRYGQLMTIEQAIEANVGKLKTKDEIFLEKEKEREKLLDILKVHLGSMSCYFSQDNQVNLLKLKRSIGLDKLIVSLKNVKIVFDNLPTEPTIIPFYANKWFHNPHCLDEKEVTGTIMYMLFRNFDSIIEDKSLEKMQWISTAEFKNELLINFNFIRDNVSRFTMLNGLSAIDNKGNQVQSFVEQIKIGIPWAITVKQLLLLKSISPLYVKEVLVIENNGVFDILTSMYPQFPMVLTSGQFNYADWLVLEKIVCSGCKIVYTSDLDTAGVGMAQNILNRFPGKVELLGMDIDSYCKIKKAEEIVDLSTLERIEHPDLIPLKTIMLEKKLKGFQEGLLEIYVKWIEKRIDACSY